MASPEYVKSALRSAEEYMQVYLRCFGSEEPLALTLASGLIQAIVSHRFLCLASVLCRVSS